MSRKPYTGPLRTEADLVEDLIIETTKFHEEHLRVTVANALEACESPIERVLMAALVANAYMFPGPELMIYGRARQFADIRPAFDSLHIYPQVSVDGYRLDFLALDVEAGVTVRHTVIEVDGHDYHERTRQQASHDKKRDRYFTSKGWQVVRYTGGDIWRNAAGCAREALAIARGLGEEL